MCVHVAFCSKFLIRSLDIVKVPTMPLSRETLSASGATSQTQHGRMLSLAQPQEDKFVVQDHNSSLEEDTNTQTCQGLSSRILKQHSLGMHRCSA